MTSRDNETSRIRDGEWVLDFQHRPNGTRGRRAVLALGFCYKLHRRLEVTSVNRCRSSSVGPKAENRCPPSPEAEAARECTRKP